MNRPAELPVTEAAKPASRGRRVAGRLLLLLMASAGGLLLLEGLVRVGLPRYNPRNQLILRPTPEGIALGVPFLTCRQGTPKGDFDVTVSFNRHGFRDRKDYLQAGTNDLFVTGDSFSLGWGVEEEARYSNLLEAMTGVPVYNISTPGEDIRGYGRVLELVRRSGGRPGHLVLGLCMENDLWDYEQTADRHQLYAQQARRTLRHQLAGWCHAHSALWVCCAFTLQRQPALRGLFERLGIARNIEELTHPNVAAPAVLASSRNALLGVVTNCHAVVLIIPSRGLWYGKNRSVEEQVHREFVRLLGQAGLQVVDLKPVFEQAGDPLQFYFKNDPHWNSRGHAAAARALDDFFTRTPDWARLRRKTGPPARP